MIDQLRAALDAATTARDELRATLPAAPLDWSPRQLATYQQASRRLHRLRAQIESAQAIAQTAAEPRRSTPYTQAAAFQMIETPDDFLGTWAIGIQAKAEVYIPYGADGTCIIQPVTSPGLWGVSDPEPTYKAQVYADELTILEDMLDALGVEIIAASVGTAPQPTP